MAYDELESLLAPLLAPAARPRDSQRSKVYAAERDAFPRSEIGPQWKTLGEVEAWIEKKVLTSAYVRKNYAIGYVGLRPGKGCRNAFANPDTYEITLPLWARKEWVVLHEISHLIVSSRKHAFHGWKFCEVYLDLVRHCMGKEVHDRLKAEFKARNVKFTAPRAKRQLTEEQKAVLRERMAKARAAKLAKAATVAID